MDIKRIGSLACLAFCVASGLAQSVEKDPVAIVELGAATSWDVKGGAATFAPDFAVEVTPIENWLELEAGTNPFFTPERNRVGHRPAIQEAVDAFAEEWSLCSASGRSGYIQERKRGGDQFCRRLRPQGTLCSGRPGGIGSAGFLNLPTIMDSGVGMGSLRHKRRPADRDWLKSRRRRSRRTLSRLEFKEEAHLSGREFRATD